MGSWVCGLGRALLAAKEQHKELGEDRSGHVRAFALPYTGGAGLDASIGSRSALFMAGKLDRNTQSRAACQTAAARSPQLCGFVPCWAGADRYAISYVQ